MVNYSRIHFGYLCLIGSHSQLEPGLGEYFTRGMDGFSYWLFFTSPRLLHSGFSTNKTYIVTLKNSISTSNRFNGSGRQSELVSRKFPLGTMSTLGPSGPGVICRSLLYAYPYSVYIAKTGVVILNMAPFFLFRTA